MTLSKKLFFSFFAALVIAVASFVLVIRSSMVEGFHHYIGANDQRELKALARTLANFYQQNGSWDAVRREGPLRVVPPMARPPGGPGNQPPPFRRPPPRLPSNAASGNDSNALNRLPMALPRMMPRLTLLDASGNAVWGPPPGPNWVKQPIDLDGKNIGELYLRPEERLGNELERQFLAQQEKALLITGAIILLLSALAAWWLSGHLLAPIRSLLQGHQALRRGEYGHRLAANSHDELGQLVKDFNELAQTLEQTEKLRRQWVADMSHELRTPLAVLRAELESIQDGIYPLDMQRIHLLHQDVLQLSKLVQDLHELALSDLGALNYRKESLDLGRLLSQVCAGFEARCQQQKLALTHRISGNAPFEGDPARLSQLFHNLLENSIRYTDAAGTITVSLKPSGKGYIVVIEDSITTM